MGEQAGSGSCHLSRISTYAEWEGPVPTSSPTRLRSRSCERNGIIDAQMAKLLISYLQVQSSRKKFAVHSKKNWRFLEIAESKMVEATHLNVFCLPLPRLILPLLLCATFGGFGSGITCPAFGHQLLAPNCGLSGLVWVNIYIYIIYILLLKGTCKHDPMHILLEGMWMKPVFSWVLPQHWMTGNKLTKNSNINERILSRQGECLVESLKFNLESETDVVQTEYSSLQSFPIPSPETQRITLTNARLFMFDPFLTTNSFEVSNQRWKRYYTTVKQTFLPKHSWHLTFNLTLNSFFSSFGLNTMIP